MLLKSNSLLWLFGFRQRAFGVYLVPDRFLFDQWAEWVGGRLSGQVCRVVCRCCVIFGRGFSWCLPCPSCDVADCKVLFSGTRWAARSRRSTMSWPAGRDSCTCSSTPTGRRAPTPLVARRGSASKTQPMEVVCHKLAIYFFSLCLYNNFYSILF